MTAEGASAYAKGLRAAMRMAKIKSARYRSKEFNATSEAVSRYYRAQADALDLLLCDIKARALEVERLAKKKARDDARRKP